MDYTKRPLTEQIQKITIDYCNDASLNAKAAMWEQAAKELPAVRDAFAAETNKVRAARWDDDAAGREFVARSERSQKVLADWADRVANSGAPAKIREVAALIKPTYEAVKKEVDAYNMMAATAMAAILSPEELERPFRERAGTAMNILAVRYDEAEAELAKIKGGPVFKGVNDPLDSGRAPGGPRSGGPSSGPTGQNASESAAQDAAGGAAGGAEGGAAGGAEGGAAGGAGDPSLSGGAGGAPTIPTPSLPTVPSALPHLPAGPPPIIPPALPGGGLGAPIRGTGVGGGRVPGVSLGGTGGGKLSIPPVSTGTTPFGTPTNAAPTRLAPTGAPTSPQLAATTGTGAGGMPPMMPPMAGAGMHPGGSGGVPGSGAAPRQGNSRTRRKDGGTPGLPSMLSGKAGKADQVSFAVRDRRAPKPDVPATAQLVDEDLWRVDQWVDDEQRPAGRTR
ncbi:hypothetical protein AB0425_25155 [Actinosynnema sp. NPDC051121]